MNRDKIFHAISLERERQERKFGIDGHTCANPAMPNLEKLAVLVEEVGEVAHELCEVLNGAPAKPWELLAELVQVAAVAVAWLEAEVDPDE